MRFSMIFEAQIADPGRESERRIFHEMVEQALLAEELDFDCIWAVEHHCLVRYAHLSAPETFLAYLAGATSRIELGHGVVCLPHAMNHPIKVAERVATLDILSRGRLHFGVGKGGTQQEAGAFGQKLEELQPQIDEAMAMIPRMWRDGEFSYESERIRIPPRPIHPKPWQDPHPPMYLACTREATLDMAGERGMGALVLGFGGPEDIARKALVYRAAFARRRLEDQVGAYATEHLAALCPAMVLRDGARARRIGLRGQRFFTESLAHWYNGGPEPSTEELGEEELRGVMEEGRRQVLAYLGEERIPIGTEVTGLYNPNHAYGTVEDAKAYVQRLVDAGADEILFLMQMGTVPQEAILESIRNVGEKVIPHFRERYGRGVVRHPAPAPERRAASS